MVDTIVLFWAVLNVGKFDFFVAANAYLNQGVSGGVISIAKESKQEYNYNRFVYGGCYCG